MSSAILRIEGVAKTFAGRGVSVGALAPTDFNIERGEFVTLVGPSGCGKSTLLNLLSGLVPPSEGAIWYEDRRITGVNRKIGYVTQQDNLFPWRTLRDNVAFPLELAGVPPRERHAEADRWIRRVGLEGFENAYPYELSGGMRQRANIIRTLIYEPPVILMDEPFGPLDAQTRLSLQDELLNIWEQQRQTIVFVTHDLVEAVALADRVVVITHRPGKIKDIINVPMERPRNIFEIHRQEGFDDAHSRLWNIFRHELHRGTL